MLCSANLSTPLPHRPKHYRVPSGKAPVDLSGVICSATQSTYLVRRSQQQPDQSLPYEERNKPVPQSTMQSSQSVEFEEISLQLLNGGHARNKTFQKMYPWMDFKAIIVEDNLTKLSSRSREHSQHVIMLDLKPKTLSDNAPVIVFCMGAHQNLGSLAHFMVDLACQLKSEILAFEFSTPLANQSQEIKFTDQVVARLTAKVFKFVQAELLTHRRRKVFVYGQREGVIPASIIASQQSSSIAGLILEDGFIYYYEKKGLFKRRCKQTRFLDIFKTLKGVSLLMLHGIKGQECPFSHAKAIMKNLFSNCQNRCHLLSESRQEENGINQYRKSVFYNQGAERESAFIFESYFVECDTNQLRKLKRVQYLSSLTNFMSNVHNFIEERYELASPFHKGVEPIEESSEALNKTASMFFISKLIPTDKSSKLVQDQVILEQNEKGDEANPILDNSISQEEEQQGQNPMLLDLKADHNRRDSYRVSTASSQAKYTPSTHSGEDIRSKIASKLKKAKSSFAYSNFTEKSAFAIENMKRKVKELEEGFIFSCSSDDDHPIQLTPTNLVDPRQCCQKEPSTRNTSDTEAAP